MKQQYLGLEDKYTQKEHAQIVIQPVCFDKTTTYIHGADQGPLAIIKASENLELYDIETDAEVYKKGIYTAPLKDYSSSKNMLESVYTDTLNYLKKDKFVVTLGGEHSISFAPIKAHSDHHGPISVLQFDAHADLVFAYQANKDSHASVMARVKELSSISNTVAIGIRSMAFEEKEAVNYSNTFFAHNLMSDDHWMNEACDLLSDKVYITFDLDVFDSSLMPSTGTPEPGGLFWHQVLKFLKIVTERKKVIGFDIVELCPIKNFVAPDFLAAKLIYKILSYIFYQRR